MTIQVILPYVWGAWLAAMLAGIAYEDVRDWLRLRKLPDHTHNGIGCRHDIHGCPLNNRVIPQHEERS